VVWGDGASQAGVCEGADEAESRRRVAGGEGDREASDDVDERGDRGDGDGEGETETTERGWSFGGDGAAVGA
jgi:hypothetical protein